MRYVYDALRMNLRSAAQYGKSFLMQCLAQLVMTAGDLWAVLLLLERFGNMGHWEAGQILFFFGVMQITFAFTEIINRGLGRFSDVMIRNGGFDTVLLRPRSPLKQVILSQADPRRVGSMLVGIAAVVIASTNLSLRWTFGKILLLLWSMAGTICLLMGLFLIEAVVCFFSVQSIEVVNILTYGGRQACQYPIDLYPGPIRILFTCVVPIALCLHVPVSLVLGRPMFAVPDWLVWVFPCAGLAFFALIAFLWRFGVRHYRSTGS